MAELLVITVNCGHANAVETGGAAWVRGDVIAIMPDGHVWGRKEVNAPHFRIIKLPGAPELSLQHLLDGGEEVVRGGKTRRVENRAIRIDLDTLADREYGIVEFTTHTIDKQRGTSVGTRG